MISISIIGNLGKDAVVNNVSGKNVINFSVCHTQTSKDKDGNKTQKSTWVECSKWGETTAIAPYLLKGTKVYVEGIPEAQPWTNKEGASQATLRCMVNRIELLGKSDVQPAPVAQKGFEAPAIDPIDDLPF